MKEEKILAKFCTIVLNSKKKIKKNKPVKRGELTMIL